MNKCKRKCKREKRSTLFSTDISVSGRKKQRKDGLVCLRVKGGRQSVLARTRMVAERD
jgi:hypothetical protein